MTFLQQVANYYIDKSKSEELDLANYTFVLPNKRSAMFMRKYLKKAYDKPGFMPRLVTITSFTQEFCQRPLASSEELLFILYKSYIKVLEKKGRAEQIRDFDSFIFWGRVTLDDFNDVDAYVVDAKQLFKNLFWERKIQANYLTPEQIEVAKILGDKRPLNVDVDNFWQHLPSNPEAANTDKFLSLWEILNDLYEQFNADLLEMGLAYSGLQARVAQKAVKEMGKEDFGDKRYTFIGFYVLSTARLLILKRLRDLGIAEFFWDTASPMLHGAGNNAGDIIMPLSRELKAPGDFALEEIDSEPEITIYPISSSAGQAKACAQVLEEWRKGKDGDTDQTTIGVVLPDEKLLMPMLYSVPTSYFPINVAMKVPYQSTPLASLLSTILIMQERVRKHKGSFHFYFKEVLEILSNPYVAMALPGDVSALRNQILKEHLYNIDAIETCRHYPALSFIFKAVEDQSDMDEIKGYLDSLIKGLRELNVELAILSAYEQAIATTFALADKYNVTMREHTTFTLLRRLLASTEIHFNGNPVWGLQLMNMQDARVLDFEDLAILSLNEGILPRSKGRPSFIPPSLRSGYAMPTPEDEDKTLAYQFFRLLSRAKRVALFYDNRTPDLSQGEKSRYLSQLEMLLSRKPAIQETIMGYDGNDNKTLVIEKTPEVMADLNKLLAGGPLNFSASSLKTYLKCPLRFYLQFVKGLNIDNFDPEYMNASAYGQTMHRVAELFYKELETEANGKFITPQLIQKKLKDPKLKEHLTKLALEAMCVFYYGEKYLSDPDSIPGEGRVLAKIMAEYVKRMLQCESDASGAQPNAKPFIFVSGEDDGGAKVHHWNVDGRHVINFRMSIDRIDSLDTAKGSLRFIDYKTGSDLHEAKKFDYLFTSVKDNDCGAIFQLLLYCMAYADLNNCPDKIIKPLVYRFKDMATEGIPNLKIEKVEINDYRQEMTIGDETRKLDEAFRERLSQILDEIYDPEVPFTQAPENDHCKYCQFTQMCGRLIADN